jgi:hypothetical protein
MFMAQHYNRSSRNTTFGLVGGGRLRTDFSFAAVQKARDVRAVHEPQQNGEQQQ